MTFFMELGIRGAFEFAGYISRKWEGRSDTCLKFNCIINSNVQCYTFISRNTCVACYFNTPIANNTIRKSVMHYFNALRKTL